MKTGRFLLLFVAGLFLTGLAAPTVTFANGDDDDHGERYEHHERYEGKYRQTRRFLPPVDNALYKDECSSCHFLYLPGLLPAQSWENIIRGSKDHFGEDLALDNETSADLIAYLRANGAETTGAKRSIKIMNSLGSTVPERITTIPYIIQEHRGVRPEVFKRKAIGSFSNCGACHRTADQGIFEEDDLIIPK